jgi:hypothetical protein
MNEQLLADPYVAHDTETELISKSGVVPRLVCSAFHGYPSNTSELIPWYDREHHADTLAGLLKSNTHLVYHNAAFDLLVCVLNDPTLLPLVWETLGQGRIHDTMIREMLLNLATSGSIETALDENDQQVRYGLADLLYAYTGEDIRESKEAEDGPRTNYAAVRDMKVEEWPEGYAEYALDDPRHTLTVFQEQEVRRQGVILARGFDPLPPPVTQLRLAGHFALAIMTAQGLGLDPDEVIRVTEEYTDMYNDPKLVGPLVDAGIVMPAEPPLPYVDGRKDHQQYCCGHPEHPQYRKGRSVKECECPVKLKKPQPEKVSITTLHARIWRLAREGVVEARAGDTLIANLKAEDRDNGTSLRQRFLDGKTIRVHRVGKHFAEARANAMVELAARCEVGEQTVAHIESILPDDIAKQVRKPGCDPALAAMFEDYQREVRELKALKDSLAEVESHNPFGVPKGWNVVCDGDWMEEYAPLDDILMLYSERKKIEKIVTSYLPSLYWAEGYEQCPRILGGHKTRISGKTPAERAHFPYQPLKETGRTSSRTATKGRGDSQILLYPSMNGQQVDPRIRPCFVADGFLACGTETPDLDTYKGNVLYSIDYSAMELGTWAQECINIFGYSVMAEKINAGEDPHAFLGAQIAATCDREFSSFTDGVDRDKVFKVLCQLKGVKDPCTSPQYMEMKPGASWGDFYDHYRTFAKPTGLGYPGGLGPDTFRAYARGTFGIVVDLEMAQVLREVWKSTYDEAGPYLEYINKQCQDPYAPPTYTEDDDGKVRERAWYCYTSPLGMHRARAPYTAVANGLGLQTPGAEGALRGVWRAVEACTTGSLAGKMYPCGFIHDEQIGEVVWKGPETTEWVRAYQKIMEDAMMATTPDVVSRTEAALMFRWNKKAKPVLVDGVLVPWVPEIK